MRNQVRSSKVHSNSEKKVNSSNLKQKKDSSTKKQIKVRRKKIHKFRLRKEENRPEKICPKFLNKQSVAYLILLILDIIFVIFMARKNIVHYVNEFGKNIYIGKTRYLLVGRNYITLVITAFFYCYICFFNHFFLHKKNTKRFLVRLFFFLIILNCFLFFIFTKRVY